MKFGSKKGDFRGDLGEFGPCLGPSLVKQEKTKGSNDYSISGGEGVSGPGEEAEDGWGYKSKTGRAFNLGKGSLF